MEVFQVSLGLRRKLMSWGGTLFTGRSDTSVGSAVALTRSKEYVADRRGGGVDNRGGGGGWW